MAFLPPVVGYLVKRGLEKGESRAPLDLPGYALANHSLLRSRLSGCHAMLSEGALRDIPKDGCEGDQADQAVKGKIILFHSSSQFYWKQNTDCGDNKMRSLLLFI